MSKNRTNRENFSHKNLWFLRGLDLEDNVPKDKTLGIYKKRIVNCFSSAKDMTYVPSINRHFIIESKQPSDRIIGFNISIEREEIECVMRGANFISICSMQNNLYVLDLTTSKILEFEVDVLYSKITLKNKYLIPPEQILTEDFRIIAFYDHNLNLRILLWERDSAVVSIGVAKREFLSFKTVSYAKEIHSSKSIRLYDAVVDKTKNIIYMSDSENNQILSIRVKDPKIELMLSKKQLGFKVIKKNPNSKKQTTYQYVPGQIKGLCLFQFFKSQIEETIKRIYEPEISKDVLDNSFLIVADSENKGLVTISLKKKKYSVLPLIGCVDKDFVTNNQKNLLIYNSEINNVSDVIIGFRGALFFGEFNKNIKYSIENDFHLYKKEAINPDSINDTFGSLS